MDINHPEVLAKLLNQSEANVVDQLQSQEVIKRTRANFELAKALAATALPHLLIDVGQANGYQLIGNQTADIGSGPRTCRVLGLQQ